MLLAGGGNDLVATRLHLSINTVTWAVRVAVFVVPAVVFVITRRICLGLQLRDLELVEHGRETGVIKRLPHGEYVEVRRPLDQARRYTLTAHPAARRGGGAGPDRPSARDTVRTGSGVRLTRGRPTVARAASPGRVVLRNHARSRHTRLELRRYTGSR
ncbi:hypothetical protein GCM10009535_60430 [Streptomyces thermocarboxydovorans]|uniref:Uncharacterized protein n=1 Tax=Streptomyces thermocarboxydovorans TaxID=59298 RepID=A0ABN1HY92_9ACTN